MSPAIELLSRTLARRDALTYAEMEMLSRLDQRLVSYARGADIIAEKSRPTNSCLVVSGIAARAVLQVDGRRQLTALHIPGDFVDLHGLMLKTMDHSVVALTDCSVVFIPHEQLTAITERAPHLTRILWLITIVDAAVQRRMTALIGRYTPVQRLAHLICELYVRLEIVGLVRDNAFSFPVRQADVADVLGLSLVHTNRTIRDLRATKLMTWDAVDVVVHDFDRLARLAGFDDTHLSLVPEPR